MKSVDDWKSPATTLQMGSESPSPAAAAPQPGAAVRVVATIIDPSVREDGLGEPVLLMARDRARGAVGEDVGLGGGVRIARGHAVRERLMARARAASSPPASTGHAGTEASGAAGVVGERSAPIDGGAGVELGAGHLEDDGDPVARFDALPELSDDLDLIGAPERRPAPAPVKHGPPLTAPAALLFGTLLGITALAVTFSVLIQVAPQLALSARAPAPAAEGSAPVPPAVTAAPEGTVVRPARKRTAGPWRISDATNDSELSIIEGKVGNNSFLGAVQASGVSLREAYRVLKAFEGVKDLNRSRPRDAFSALVEKATGRLSAFEYKVSGEEVYQARQGPDGLLLGMRLDLQVRRERVSGVIVVSGGFEAAAERAGFEPGLGEVVNKALAGYSSVGEMKDGDVVAVVAQEVTTLGEFARYAGVEALEYRSVDSEPVRVYYHADEKTRGYVDSRGRVFGKSRWARPVPGAAITSRFNPKRLHPILKIVKPHNGTDFGAPTGTPVVASASGRVTFLGRAGPNGNMITLSHDGGYETGYSHLSRFAKGLGVGQRVDQKQVIGYVGSTGRSTGPHLHFSAKRNTRFIDPESLNLDAFSRLAVSDRQVLSQLKQRYDRLLDALPIPEPKALQVAAAEPRALEGEERDESAEGVQPSLSALALMPAKTSEPRAAAEPVARAVTAPSAFVEHAASPVSAAAGATPPAQPLSIYLTDRELIMRQPAVHAGEVDP